jgi:hypothetical protein
VSLSASSDGSPYRRTALPHGAEGLPALDWRRALQTAVTLALGFVVAPAVIGRLSVEAHAVLPEIFVALAVVAGGSLALLFAKIDA